ncbi:MAG: deoxyribodipyrimidine photo-lyase [Candidatus Sumerlaeaceae bacterium]|jgi:deoxyribodipyrimidine photo-lyase
MLQQERIRILNNEPVRPGQYVLYWMQQSQRLHWNHAFEYAVAQANARGQQVVIAFAITPNFPEANLRHYEFLFQGLEDVVVQAQRRGVCFIARVGSPDEVILDLSRHASEVVVDCGYLRIQRLWRENAAKRLVCRLTEIETDAVVPVRVASQKEQYSAAALRPRLHRLLPSFLLPIEEQSITSHPKAPLPFPSTTAAELWEIASRIAVDRSVPPVPGKRGGTSHALEIFEHFLREKIESYALLRNNPLHDVTSGLSPYLHFGHISPLYVAWRVAALSPSLSRDAFLEQLIVRRELSLNFVTFNSAYDSYDCLPEWAKATLETHAKDRRLYVYSCEEFEKGQTHDPMWNACQHELVTTGSLHNYLRMYWGKKILEWSSSPRAAFDTAIYLNNKYQLDGRDPNSFSGVAWCFGKHDRPWPQRPIYGSVRAMAESGLRKKFDVQKYISHVLQGTHR